MQLPPLSREQVRQIDQRAIERYGIPSIVLMENAGRGAAETIASIVAPQPIVIVCGKGNNAGDGYVIARHLDLLNHDVRIVSIVELSELSGDAEINATIAGNAGLSIEVVRDSDALTTALQPAATIVDGLLGTGASGNLRGLYADAVRIANQRSALRIAIDVPTGLDCDSGQPGDPTFRAEHTITFVAPKIGFQTKNADAYVGVVHVVGIGAPRHLLGEFSP